MPLHLHFFFAQCAQALAHRVRSLSSLAGFVNAFLSFFFFFEAEAGFCCGAWLGDLRCAIEADKRI